MTGTVHRPLELAEPLNLGSGSGNYFDCDIQLVIGRILLVLNEKVARVQFYLRKCYVAVSNFPIRLRVRILRLAIKQVGQNLVLGRRVTFSAPQNIEIGDNVFINTGCMLHAEGGLTIGSDTKIGPFTTIWTSTHNFSDFSIPIREQGYTYAPVRIGRDVWIGAQVTIVAGITIGEGSVIGANAVVTKDVPSYSISVGNPAHIIKMRQP